MAHSVDSSVARGRWRRTALGDN